MLKHLIKTSASSGGDTTITVDGTTYQVFYLQVVASDNSLAVFNIRITGGSTGGEVHLLTYRSNNVVADAGFSISADDVVYLDGKEFYEAGDTLAMYATEAGITVEVFGDYSATA